MKKTSSLVWRFFDRIEENKRCVEVLCRLCEKQYKYFGNTTNLRSHMLSKHPIQWELLQNGKLDETTFRVFDDDDPHSVTPRRRKKYVKVKNVDLLENSDIGNDSKSNDETESIIHQIQNSHPSNEEWLEEEWTHVETYEPKQKKLKYRQIKREATSPPQTSTPSYVYWEPAKSHTQSRASGQVTKKDEFSVFGEYIGNKLRKLKSYQTSVNVQQLITTILWQAEYGVFDSLESVKRIVLSTVQEMDSTMNTNHEEVEMNVEEIIIDNKEPELIIPGESETLTED